MSTPSVLSPQQPGENNDDYQDRLFGELVHKSWDHLAAQRFASHIDEVFLGALITGSLNNGYKLIDLTSDGTHHFCRFEQDDKSRLVFRMTHLTGELALAKVLGQRASVVVGYGEKVGDVSKILSAIRAEMQGGFLQSAEPGTITVDGDLETGYVYVQVDLTLSIDDYVTTNYEIDHNALSAHIGACKHALSKYLKGRFA